jgi:hypothetical protein
VIISYFAGDIFGPFLNFKTGPLAPKTTIAEPPVEISSSPEQFGEFVDSPENLPGSGEEPTPPRPGKAYEDPAKKPATNEEPAKPGEEGKNKEEPRGPNSSEPPFNQKLRDLVKADAQKLSKLT